MDFWWTKSIGEPFVSGVFSVDTDSVANVENGSDCMRDQVVCTLKYCYHCYYVEVLHRPTSSSHPVNVLTTTGDIYDEVAAILR